MSENTREMIIDWLRESHLDIEREAADMLEADAIEIERLKIEIEKMRLSF